MGPGMDFEKFFGTLRDISSSIDDQTQVEPVLETVVRKTTEALSARGALIRIFNPQNRQMELMAAHGLSKEYLSKGPVPSDRIIADLCSLNRIDIVRDMDILNNPRIHYPQEVWREGVRMILDAPLNYKQDTLGLLRFFFSDSRDFLKEELNFIVLIAERAASVIHRAQLFQKQQTRYDQLAQQTEKLSALGRMAAGIAHEINNPLGGILLFATNMLKKVPPESPLKEGIEIIVQETIRCKTIIQELLEFSRESEPKKALTDINQVIEKALTMLENQFRLHHIRLHQELTRPLPEILIDANQINQVLVNLLLNAVQAIGEQGGITVRTGLSPDHKCIDIEVADTGGGILPEHLPKIFEPFFSTKPKGTGLGLAVTFGIVQKHGGQIHAASQPGRGTKFYLELPISAENADAET